MAALMLSRDRSAMFVTPRRVASLSIVVRSNPLRNVTNTGPAGSVKGLPEIVLRSPKVPTVLSAVSGAVKSRSLPKFALNGFTVPAVTAACNAEKSAFVVVRLLVSTKLKSPVSASRQSPNNVLKPTPACAVFVALSRVSGLGLSK